jgi:hypothetical protein
MGKVYTYRAIDNGEFMVRYEELGYSLPLSRAIYEARGVDEMKISRNARDIKDGTTAKVVDVEQQPAESKAGKKYLRWVVYVLPADAEIPIKVSMLTTEIMPLVRAWGYDTDGWKGKQVKLYNEKVQLASGREFSKVVIRI